MDARASSQLLDSTASASAGYGDQTTHAQLESTDPRYLESLYPGWKYDEATKQWYQVVDALRAQSYAAHDTSAAVAALGSDSPQLQQQQQSSDSYLQNNSHAELAHKPTEATPEPNPGTAAAPPDEEVGAEHEPVPAHTEIATEARPAMPLPESGPDEAHKELANADEATVATEGGSPGSEKGIHTAIKQVQWNDFGASTGAGGTDPFGDLLPDGGAEDDFFGGTVPGNQGIQESVVGTKSVSEPDRSLSAGVDYSATIGAGLAISGGVGTNASSQLDYGGQSTKAQLDSTDPKYLESLYPGWKYDEATRQWYQVDTLSAQSYAADNTGAAAVLGNDNIQQNQQQVSASYLQNNSHAALETIAEESSTNAASWG